SQAIQRLEAQVGQLAKELSERKKGEFPSQTIPNPGGQEQLKAVTVLRSGKVVDNKKATKVSEKEKVIFPPFPQRLVKQKKEKHLLDIFETLRKVEINIPLLDAIKQIPSYAKFLKDCCTHKRQFLEHEKVALTEEVSALNNETRKDHFPLPFIDQMLERLASHSHYCFLDGYSGYNQIAIAPEDQEKTTFTCPFGTFAYRRMPFGLCNAPATFQRCMMSVFSDIVERFIEVFMDDFSVFGSNFDNCLNHLQLVLKRCEECNLVLNWEK
ncbi:unnamed protein product, partial [Prunus brigantina]